MRLTKTNARKILAVVDAGLVSGLGIAEPGKMCVEAAICYGLGLPHGDQPQCVAAFIRTYKIKINDARWSSNKARTTGMRRAAIAQLGSDFLDLRENREKRNACVQYIIEQTICRILPLSLRRAAKLNEDKIHADRLIEAALRCENEGTVESVTNAKMVGRAAADAAAAAAGYAATAAAADADADAAAYTAAAAAGYAATATAAAADADADAAAYAAAAAAGYAAAAAAGYAATAGYDNVLNIAAGICVEACIKFETPGSKWLDITE